MKIKSFLLALLLCAVAQPSWAAITAVSLGSHNQAASATNSRTSGNACAAGSLAYLATSYIATADTLSSGADGVSNTWQTPFDNITGTGVGLGSAYAKNITTGYASGVTTITATFAGSTSTDILALCIGGITSASPLDITNKTSQGLAATAATSIPSGTLSYPNEVLVGIVATATAFGTASCGSGWTVKGTTISDVPSILVCTQIVSTNASVTFSPTWTNAVNYVADVVSFAATNHNLTTMGAGN